MVLLRLVVVFVTRGPVARTLFIIVVDGNQLGYARRITDDARIGSAILLRASQVSYGRDRCVHLQPGCVPISQA